MEDIFIGIAALILQIFLQILLATKRPWKYILFSDYRRKLNIEWSDKPKVLFYSYIFSGFLLLLLSLGIVGYLICFFFFMPKPESTPTEELKGLFKQILIESINDAKAK